MLCRVEGICEGQTLRATPLKQTILSILAPGDLSKALIKSPRGTSHQYKN